MTPRRRPVERTPIKMTREERYWQRWARRVWALDLPYWRIQLLAATAAEEGIVSR